MRERGRGREREERAREREGEEREGGLNAQDSFPNTYMIERANEPSLLIYDRSKKIRTVSFHFLKKKFFFMLVAETRKSPMHLPLNVWPSLASSFRVELELDPLTH